MLKVDGGAVIISGKKIELMAELTQLIHALVDDEEVKCFTKEDIDLCVKTAFMSTDEVKEQADGILSKFIDDLFANLLE